LHQRRPRRQRVGWRYPLGKECCFQARHQVIIAHFRDSGPAKVSALSSGPSKSLIRMQPSMPAPADCCGLDRSSSVSSEGPSTSTAGLAHHSPQVASGDFSLQGHDLLLPSASGWRRHLIRQFKTPAGFLVGIQENAQMIKLRRCNKIQQKP